MAVIHFKVKGDVYTPCGVRAGGPKRLKKVQHSAVIEEVTCKNCLRIVKAVKVERPSRSLPHLGTRAVNSEFHN